MVYNMLIKKGLTSVELESSLGNIKGAKRSSKNYEV